MLPQKLMNHNLRCTAHSHSRGELTMILFIVLLLPTESLPKQKKISLVRSTLQSLEDRPRTRAAVKTKDLLFSQGGSEPSEEKL